MPTSPVPLPPPPLPHDLRERFRNHPYHLAELERALESVVSKRSIVPDPFERAVWSLTDTIESFSIDARVARKRVEDSGDALALARADEELVFMLHSGTALRYDLDALAKYFRDHREAFL